MLPSCMSISSVNCSTGRTVSLFHTTLLLTVCDGEMGVPILTLPGFQQLTQMETSTSQSVHIRRGDSHFKPPTTCFGSCSYPTV